MKNDYLSSLIAIQNSLEAMQSSLTAAYAPLNSVSHQTALAIQQQLNTVAIPQFNSAFQAQALNEALIAPIRQMLEMQNTSIASSFRDSLITNDAILKQTQALQNSMSSLASAFHGIQIHESYASVPEILIPDGFQYEEVPDTSSIREQKAEQTANTKNLSLSNTLALLNLFIPILICLVAPFYNHTIENFLSEREKMEADTLITEEQAQQILEYLSELTDYQQAILTALETSHKSTQDSVLVPPDTDSPPSNADYNSQCVPSPPDLVEEPHPTEADDSESSELR